MRTSRAVTGRERPRVAVVAVLCLALALGACGSDASTEAQPRPPGTGFGEGVFDDLPLHPRSDPVASLTEKDDATVRSYRTDGATPREVLDFYEDQLPGGWQLIGAVEEIGPDSYRGTWVRDDQQLEVSATPAPRLDQNDTAEQVVTQYSFTLTDLEE